MPKIIENLKEQLLQEAKRQIAERGYAQTTIRSIAAGCGVGVGTVYNYFQSKEMLIATFMYEEWKKYLEEMSMLSQGDPKIFLKGVYDLLKAFAKHNEKLFSDPDATKLASTGFSQRHKILRSQISSFILPLCEVNQLDNPQFTAEFISESIIRWSMENKDFDELYSILKKIIIK